jgi:peptidoglycan/LPS O-acetylase OafA/YrhL
MTATQETGHGPASPRLPGLDGLRAIAIALVVLLHYGYFYPADPALVPFLNFGAFGVQAFFCISGFLITHLLLREEAATGRVSLPAFYARRSLRILPPLLLYLAAVAAMTSLGIVEVPGGDLAACLLFFRNYAGEAYETGHCWSLSIEEQFYAAWPFLLAAIPGRRARLAALLATLTVLPGWRQVAYRLHGGAAHINRLRTDLNLDFLVAGAALACLLATPRGARMAAGRVASGPRAVAVAVATILAIHLTPLGEARVVRSLVPTVGALCMAAIVNAAIRGRPATALLDRPAVAWLGRLSYSLYLWQQLFVPHQAGARPWFRSYPANLVLALVTATLSYYALERPLLSLRGRLRRGAAPGPGTGRIGGPGRPI